MFGLRVEKSWTTQSYFEPCSFCKVKKVKQIRAYKFKLGLRLYVGQHYLTALSLPLCPSIWLFVSLEEKGVGSLIYINSTEQIPFSESDSC
jgi:hypothetical protein